MNKVSTEDLSYDMRQVAQTCAKFLMSLADARVLQLNVSRLVDQGTSKVQQWLQNNVNNTSSQQHGEYIVGEEGVYTGQGSSLFHCFFYPMFHVSLWFEPKFHVRLYESMSNVSIIPLHK